jgi:hypothetical protein
MKQTTTEERRARVAGLYLEGQTQFVIAKEVGVNQSTVSRDLEAIRAEWRGSALRDFGERQAEELARIDKLETEAWAAWHRSKLPSEVTTAERVVDEENTAPAKSVVTADLPAAPPARTKATKRVENRDGDPRFLAVVHDCIKRRCELLGLDEPKEHNVDVNLPDLRTVSDDQLSRLYAALAEVFSPPRLPVAPGGDGRDGAAGEPASLEQVLPALPLPGGVRLG